MDAVLPDSGLDWGVIRRGAVDIMRKTFRNVVQASYGGVFVDRDQDCDKVQHELVLSLAKLLPCRIVGDPLQAVFRGIHKGEALDWEEATRLSRSWGS